MSVVAVGAAVVDGGSAFDDGSGASLASDDGANPRRTTSSPPTR